MTIRQLETLHVADLLLRYVRDLGVAIREDPRVRLGASTRGLRALVRCLQVYAAAQGRNYVVPSDVQRLAVPVLAHRTVLTRDAALAGHTPTAVVHDALESVPPPQPDGAEPWPTAVRRRHHPRAGWWAGSASSCSRSASACTTRWSPASASRCSWSWPPRWSRSSPPRTSWSAASSRPRSWSATRTARPRSR